MDTIAPGEVDNRIPYAIFAVAYLVGHGAAALSKGPDPIIDLPVWLPLTLFGLGLVPALTLSVLAGVRAQKGAGESRQRAEKLLGTAWCTAFVALFLAITGVSADRPELQDVLWPAGSVLVVGLINIAEGSARGNALHYTLGSWLALIAAGSLFFDIPGLYATLAVAAGGGYAVAAVLERRRLSAPVPGTAATP